MAQLNLKQIVDKLNDEFTGESRKLVFWYDGKGEFEEDIESLELTNAKVLHLKTNNQFYAKYLLERVDKTTNYLIYAPFKKPVKEGNHLMDTLKYSKEFFADRASLLSVDLGIDESSKPTIQKYIKFFNAKERTQRFYDLDLENITPDMIEAGIMSVLCKARNPSFDEVLRSTIMEGELDNNKYLEEFDKYDLTSAFWRFCGEYFGYKEENPTLEKLVFTMFITYTDRVLHGDSIKGLKNFISEKAGNIIVFLDNLMNSILYSERYDEISSYVASELKIEESIKGLSPEVYINCDTFKVVDKFIIEWIKERLLQEDTGATINGKSLIEICEERCKKHFGKVYKNQYKLLEASYHLVKAANYKCPDPFKEIVKQYVEADSLIDTNYRKFHYYYDGMEDNSEFQRLRDLVENIYSNEYLSKVVSKWNTAFLSDNYMSTINLQRNFYDRYIRSNKERVIVIISDALRYETGRELFERLQENEKCTANLEVMLGVLPSFTKLGMAALLPHNSLEITNEYKVLVDGVSCDDLKHREAILRRHSGESRCVQFDDIKHMKREELRSLLNGTDVVYIYHNQIDARGDKANTEDEVFVACEEAIKEISDLIKSLTNDISATHFIVTGDHGFIYKRDKLQESDKIENIADKGALVNRRFIISDTPYKESGVCSVSLGKILGNNDEKYISFPLGSNIFKVSGGGQNYVHGGSSPQEMLIPVVDVRTVKGHKETHSAGIMLVSMVQKITNLITTLDFIQTEAVSDVVKATNYKIYFVSEDNEKISNENIYVADKKDEEPQKRIFRLKFSFKDKEYDRSKKYYLVAYDEKNNREVLRHNVVMDIAFAKGFGFNL